MFIYFITKQTKVIKQPIDVFYLSTFVFYIGQHHHDDGDDDHDDNDDDNTMKESSNSSSNRSKNKRSISEANEKNIVDDSSDRVENYGQSESYGQSLDVISSSYVDTEDNKMKTTLKSRLGLYYCNDDDDDDNDDDCDDNDGDD